MVTVVFYLSFIPFRTFLPLRSLLPVSNPFCAFPLFFMFIHFSKACEFGRWEFSCRKIYTKHHLKFLWIRIRWKLSVSGEIHNSDGASFLSVGDYCQSHGIFVFGLSDVDELFTEVV